MPKIIENIQEKLLVEARRQVMEDGYSAMTIRSVAAACSVGVGTVYNYFSSKDMLVATFMLADWQQCLQSIGACCTETPEPIAVLHCIYDELCGFMEKYATLFRDERAGKSFARAFGQRHGLLRDQIAAPLRPICTKTAKDPSDFLPDFIAESMLTWTVAGKSFEEIYNIVQHFFI